MVVVVVVVGARGLWLGVVTVLGIVGGVGARGGGGGGIFWDWERRRLVVVVWLLVLRV